MDVITTTIMGIAILLTIGFLLILAAIAWWSRLDSLQKMGIEAIILCGIVVLLAPYWKEILTLVLAIVGITVIVVVAIYLLAKKASGDY